MYVLLHFDNFKEQDPNNPQKLIDRGVVDPQTKRIGVYTKATYEEYTRENEKEGKVNTFNKMLGKYIVLHDPTAEVEEEKEPTLNDLTKAQLIEKFNSESENVSEEDAKFATKANKAELIELITKYQTA